MPESSVQETPKKSSLPRLVLALALALGLPLLGAPVARAAALLGVSPLGQSAGGTVTLSGSGFAASAQVTFTLDAGTSTATTLGSVTADTTGAFSGVTITVPSGTPAGSHQIVATDPTNPTTTLNVDTIAVSPIAGAPGDPLTVTGAGWPPGDLIQTQIGGSTVCQLVANKQGQIAGDQTSGCRVPPTLASGGHPLTANDLTNLSGQATGASFTVPSRPPVAAFSPTFATVLAGSPVAFDGTLSTDPDGTISSYSWRFGDGASSTSPRPTHTYTNIGTFAVSLTVVDSSGNAGTTSHQITVIAPPPIQTLVLTPLAAPAIVKFGPPSTTRAGLVNLGQREFCPGLGPRCIATIIATSKMAGQRVRVARSVITIGPNHSAKLTFKLSKAAQAVLRKHRRLSLRIRITTTRGGQVTTRTLNLTLRRVG